jgi:hypothetical protein
MLKTTFIAAAAMSFLALGTVTADAKSGYGHGGHGSHGHNGHGGYSHHGKHNYSRFNHFWLNYSWGRPYCRYERRKVAVRVLSRSGYPYTAWVWRNVKVCA